MNQEKGTKKKIKSKIKKTAKKREDHMVTWIPLSLEPETLGFESSTCVAACYDLWTLATQVLSEALALNLELRFAN